MKSNFSLILGQRNRALNNPALGFFFLGGGGGEGIPIQNVEFSRQVMNFPVVYNRKYCFHVL